MKHKLSNISVKFWGGAVPGLEVRRGASFRQGAEGPSETPRRPLAKP